jgi:hypothetical protein
MQKEEAAIPVAKWGKYKQSLIDVQKWQDIYRKRTSPLFQLLHWVMGN